LLLAFIGLNCSAFLAAPAAALAEAVETANSSRSGERSAQPAKSPRVIAASQLKKTGTTPAPSSPLALPEPLTIATVVATAVDLESEAVPLGVSRALFQARAPPSLA
jgi:hypothetical protein